MLEEVEILIMSADRSKHIKRKRKLSRRDEIALRLQMMQPLEETFAEVANSEVENQESIEEEAVILKLSEETSEVIIAVVKTEEAIAVVKIGLVIVDVANPEEVIVEAKTELVIVDEAKKEVAIVEVKTDLVIVDVAKTEVAIAEVRTEVDIEDPIEVVKIAGDSEEERISSEEVIEVVKIEVDIVDEVKTEVDSVVVTAEEKADSVVSAVASMKKEVVIVDEAKTEANSEVPGFSEDTMIELEDLKNVQPSELNVVVVEETQSLRKNDARV